MKKLTQKIVILTAVILVITGLFWQTNKAVAELKQTYEKRQSIVIRDRHGEIIQVKQNPSGYYAIYTKRIPKSVENLLLLKEDRYFYYHKGVNPGSVLRAISHWVRGGSNLASSTVTQQLVKILLSQENERTFTNKLIETWYALSLELRLSKEEILIMYVNSIYFGNSVQGIQSASELYFGSTPESLRTEEVASLVSTISDPSKGHPFTNINSVQTNLFLQTARPGNESYKTPGVEDIQDRKERFLEQMSTKTAFELQELGLQCSSSCTLTIDKALTEQLREILERNILHLETKNVHNGAIVVLSNQNELLAMIGSPNPTEERSGYKINMAVRPRPIGSTMKPFIYLKGFEKGLRPYTIVDDREYRYTVGSGFSFYPKNYDYTYHGPVSLHYALTNSLNVPTVKVLEYIGIENFTQFLIKDLAFTPIQDIRNYELGIALGGLEMDLAHLAYYFTLFPRHGNISPLRFVLNGPSLSIPSFQITNTVASRPYIELVTKILSDRQTGIEQFGDKSSLTLLQKNYAVKTGTSREYHDSWTVGYTPDFVLGVWVGNSDNTPMDAVSGQLGAGTIWHESMNALFATPYNKKTPFTFSSLKEFQDGETLEFGLPYDDFEAKKQLLVSSDLILNPHNDDRFLLERNTTIRLEAAEVVTWYIDDVLEGTGKTLEYRPTTSGPKMLRAKGKEKEATIRFFLERSEVE